MIYGDKVSHFHIHIVLKVRDGLQWGGPFTDDIPKVTLELGNFKSMRQAILSKMDANAQLKDLSAVEHLM